jgi:hypothetical protein
VQNKTIRGPPCDPVGHSVFPQLPNQAHKIVGAAGDRDAPTALLAGCCNKYLVTMLGNVDAY